MDCPELEESHHSFQPFKMKSSFSEDDHPPPNPPFVLKNHTKPLQNTQDQLPEEDIC